ncbi:MAG: hypothetical protein ACFFAN_00115 [Promethearchaeota archaeon]
MKEKNTSMKFRFTHQPKHLIRYGIIFIILCTSTLIAFYFGIINDFSPSPLGEFVLFIIIFIILEPCVIFWGLFRIRIGRKKIMLEIEGIHIRKYENQQLKLEIKKDEVKKITYIYRNTAILYGVITYRLIIFELFGNRKIEINSGDKNEVPKVNEFIEFLENYSKNYDIKFEKIIKDDFNW